MKRLLVLATAIVTFGAGCMSNPLIKVEAPVQPEAPAETMSPPETPTVAEPQQDMPSPPETTQPITKPVANPPSPPVTQPVVKPPEQIVGKVFVTITDTGFSPQVVAISAGDTVVWTNKGTSNHTVASNGALIYDSGNIPAGTSWSRTFSAPGSYGYHCGAHPSEGGTVVVR
ncbi:cupredoxin domain-containing protein [Patescibacteria group bacterium]|nr:cupredoxin domain-containing protein [Patescibacteria group bacterium]MBU1448871.1 cupredoxin domain-containing protein [Patescibacteria group bacterium]MBU2613639.1 cupredoxin domain-containing protein [Patescibacteria group bacterium]